MKILVLCYEYPPVGGGGGRVAAVVAEELARRGHEIRVVTAGLSHLPESEVRAGVEIIRPRSGRRREDTCTVPEMAFYLATAFPAALAQCLDWKPDAIHAHFAVPTGILALALNVCTSIPYALTAHLGDVPGGVPEQTRGLFRFLDPAIRPVWTQAAAVTAVSRFVANLARVHYGIDPQVILNGVEMASNSTAPAPVDPPRILQVGRLSIQKNPVLAVEALALLKDCAWAFEIVGDGPLVGAVREAVARHGLGDRVRMTGWLGAAEVAQRMRNASIFLMPSRSEGLPMAGIEALNNGLAIVASRIGGLEDVVAEGLNGLLCEQTPLAFAGALRSLLENPARLEGMRRAALIKAMDFDLAERVTDYERLLAHIAKP